MEFLDIYQKLLKIIFVIIILYFSSETNVISFSNISSLLVNTILMMFPPIQTFKRKKHFVKTPLISSMSAHETNFVIMSRFYSLLVAKNQPGKHFIYLCIQFGSFCASHSSACRRIQNSPRSLEENRI